MSEPSITTRTSWQFETVATCILLGALVGASYWLERAYQSWSKANSLLAAPRVRIERAMTNYRSKRATLGEGLQMAGDVLDLAASLIGSSRSSER
jgi:hypothetical protein